MKIAELHIKNFKSIESVEILDIENVLIFVGRNNSGKSVILDAIRAVCGDYVISSKDFHTPTGNILIGMTIELSAEDLQYMHKNGIVSKYKDFDRWKAEFLQNLPSYQGDEKGGRLSFELICGRDGLIKYRDGIQKNNLYIRQVLPQIYFVDHYRNRYDINEDLTMLQEDDGWQQLRENRCIFDKTRHCRQCFDCMGVIEKKQPQDLTLVETSRLLQYKLFRLNLNKFADNLNRYFQKNGSRSQKIRYEIQFVADEIFKIETIVEDLERGIEGSLDSLGEGLRSIYILSLLETYADAPNKAPYIIMIEDPETYLHPQLQKVASEILYRLSKKNQVIFSTHEPEMIFNFTSKQIKQVYANQNYNTAVSEKTDIDGILNDLGYTAGDMMNVSFVFIVEGKQDSSRLPILLNRYYSEVYDDEGKLRRIAIIATNSCTNIKTYANLKYINRLYLKDQFMMLRDSDGKDRQMLEKQLCRYYKDRGREDKGNLPRVTERNVLILKYYSFENYFLFPEVMVQIGVVKSEEQFYDILWYKYKEYLHKLSSVKRMKEKLNIDFCSKQDLRDHIEDIRIYVRGHNLYDIFYGRYRSNETEILQRYIDAAPREIFADILDKIDAFVFFDSHKIKR